MRNLTHEELKQIAGGGDAAGDGNSSKLKGNNGWGNGADPSNPGSDEGGTAPSKTANASVPEAGKINTNPTDSDGR